MKVVKFGGSSVANADQISKVVQIVRADADRKIVVVSAPGKRDKYDTKVTDLLIELAQHVLQNKSYEASLEQVIDRYGEIQRDLGLSDDVLNEVREDLEHRISNRGSHDAQFMDTMKAAGEDNNARVIAAAFNHAGCSAEYVDPGEAGMLLSDEFGNAEVLPQSYEALAQLRERDEIVIFPGFFGKTRRRTRYISSRWIGYYGCYFISGCWS